MKTLFCLIVVAMTCGVAGPVWCEENAEPQPSVRWLDADANEVLFTSLDVVAFDWEQQIFHLQSEAAIDFLA